MSPGTILETLRGILGPLGSILGCLLETCSAILGGVVDDTAPQHAPKSPQKEPLRSLQEALQTPSGGHPHASKRPSRCPKWLPRKSPKDRRKKKNILISKSSNCASPLHICVDVSGSGDPRWHTLLSRRVRTGLQLAESSRDDEKARFKVLNL